MLIMDLGILAFFMVLIVFSRKFILFSKEQTQQELYAVQQIHQNLVDKKEHIVEERITVEREAHKVFVLYDIAREITRTSSVEEAFDIFKSKLRENIIFDDCLWLAADTPEESMVPDNDGSFIFTVLNDKEIIAYLLFKKMALQDKEKALILSHQFALALRRVILYQKIERIAIADNLTGVYTRHYFLERFEEEVERAQTRKINLSFLMLDVDFFKGFNDQYGHLTGDQVLKEIGSIIKANIREIDIAGRYGGEEFCVVLPDTDNPGATLAAERIRLAVEKTPIKAYDNVLKATISIGVSTFPLHGKLPDELLDKADWALYRAKKSGRNRVCTFGVYDKSG